MCNALTAGLFSLALILSLVHHLWLVFPHSWLLHKISPKVLQLSCYGGPTAVEWSMGSRYFQLMVQCCWNKLSCLIFSLSTLIKEWVNPTMHRNRSLVSTALAPIPSPLMEVWTRISYGDPFIILDLQRVMGPWAIPVLSWGLTSVQQAVVSCPIYTGLSELWPPRLCACAVSRMGKSRHNPGKLVLTTAHV